MRDKNCGWMDMVAEKSKESHNTRLSDKVFVSFGLLTCFLKQFIGVTLVNKITCYICIIKHNEMVFQV